MQHNCAAHHCDDQAQELVREERKVTSRTKSKIRHFVLKDIMLNTAQMRSAVHVQLFHARVISINCEMAIHTGARSEVAAQKEKGKGGKGKNKKSSGQAGLLSSVLGMVS